MVQPPTHPPEPCVSYLETRRLLAAYSVTSVMGRHSSSPGCTPASAQVLPFRFPMIHTSHWTFSKLSQSARSALTLIQFLLKFLIYTGEEDQKVANKHRSELVFGHLINQRLGMLLPTRLCRRGMAPLGEHDYFSQPFTIQQLNGVPDHEPQTHPVSHSYLATAHVHRTRCNTGKLVWALDPSTKQTFSLSPSSDMAGHHQNRDLLLRHPAWLKADLCLRFLLPGPMLVWLEDCGEGSYEETI